jgi:hypothetical protein
MSQNTVNQSKLKSEVTEYSESKQTKKEFYCICTICTILQYCHFKNRSFRLYCRRNKIILWVGSMKEIEGEEG